MEKSENILNNRTYTSDVVVNIQCTEEDKEKIEKLAFEAGQTVDEYMANVFIDKINDEKQKTAKPPHHD